MNTAFFVLKDFTRHIIYNMVCDFHNDLLTANNAFDILKDYSTREIKVVLAVFKGKRSYNESVKICKNFNNFKAENCYLALEDLGYESLESIKSLLDFKPIYCTLTWNGENILGYGCHKDSSLGLKSDGLKLIKTLNEKKIYVDTAHINERGFYDVMDNSEYIVNSHTAFYGAFAHMRNLKDEQLKLLISKKSLIGLVLYSEFLTGNSVAKIDDFIRHIDYFVQRFGYNNLCVGSDFYGAYDFVEGVADYGDFGLIEEKLSKLGYAKQAIDGILFKNLEDFLFKTSIDKSGKKV